MAANDSIALPLDVKDLTGQRFGRLIVLAFAGRQHRQLYWLCRCDCGNEKAVVRGSLTSGRSRSCGCLRSEKSAARRRTHGKTNSREYRSWSRMFVRCYNSNEHAYDLYGGRGIKVCDRWRSFAAFLEDMGPKPLGHHVSVERIDVNGHYCPENCRWATPKQQARNTRRNVMLTFRGKTQCISAWSEELGIGQSTLRIRLKYGWSVERALSEPVHR